MRAFIEAIVRPKAQDGTAARTAGGEAPQRPEPRPDKIQEEGSHRDQLSARVHTRKYQREQFNSRTYQGLEHMDLSWGAKICSSSSWTMSRIYTRLQNTSKISDRTSEHMVTIRRPSRRRCRHELSLH